MDYSIDKHKLEDLTSELIIVEGKYTSAIDFLEMLEGITTDKNVANKIRKFLVDRNIWKK